MILRLDPPFWMETPRGQALAHFLIDRGIEFDNEWICFHDNGEIWSWMNYDVRVSKNSTIGRVALSPIGTEKPK